VAKAEIFSGICGFNTTVHTHMNGASCAVSIQSECDAVERLAGELAQVNPWQEISFRGDGPTTLQMGAKYCHHPACPVPVGIIKAIEIEAGLALPQDVSIKLSKSGE
jgi:hypothetical protein